MTEQDEKTILEIKQQLEDIEEYLIDVKALLWDLWNKATDD